jgi:hypothetical protein
MIRGVGVLWTTAVTAGGAGDRRGLPVRGRARARGRRARFLWWLVLVVLR